MSRKIPDWLSDPDQLVENVLSIIGKDVRVGLPLGIGKANSIVNALYNRAENDPTISLRIYTALTLARPVGGNIIERKFLKPLFERLAGNYPELAYNAPLQDGTLPANISVHEFYFPAGRRLGSQLAQQTYTSANYTHVARDLLDAGINVIAPLVASRETKGRKKLSLSSNPDVTPDLIPELNKRREAGQKIAFAAQVNSNMPFMLGPAELDPSQFDFILHGPSNDFDLFCVPRQPVSLADYAAAIHIASLIEDGGTLQLGIGGFADGLTQILKLRHHQNDRFQELTTLLGISGDNRAHGPFKSGLYACSEMLVEGLVELKRAGIIKRRAWTKAPPGDLNPVIHASFFLGSRELYERLNELDESERQDIWMGPVSYVNQLYGDEQLKRSSRTKARFINKAMLATALGALVSDTLEDGRVVSGVGGQFNFIVQAHELEGARAIVVLDACRHERGKAKSNIVWNYGQTTIPRHLRDIVVTEYGIADLRGKCDRDVIVAMLGITDSRFQESLLRQAQDCGKIERSFSLPDAIRSNNPDRIEAMLGPARSAGLLPEFPLGTDMESVELELLPLLKAVRSRADSKIQMAMMIAAGMIQPNPTAVEKKFLDRLDLTSSDTMQERLANWLIRGAMKRL